jgi:hypothetical protein
MREIIDEIGHYIFGTHFYMDHNVTHFKCHVYNNYFDYDWIKIETILIKMDKDRY